MPTVVPPNGLRPVSELRSSDQPFVAKAPIPALVRSGWAVRKDARGDDAADDLGDDVRGLP